ncbi:hypothetical protein CIB48_g83 [Xylaria polymorpha]|nr:hypothetical protein CIB48_g83 [Xylaria polymorpha]
MDPVIPPDLRSAQEYHFPEEDANDIVTTLGYYKDESRFGVISVPIEEFEDYCPGATDATTCFGREELRFDKITNKATSSISCVGRALRYRRYFYSPDKEGPIYHRFCPPSLDDLRTATTTYANTK